MKFIDYLNCINEQTNCYLRTFEYVVRIKLIFVVFCTCFPLNIFISFNEQSKQLLLKPHQLCEDQFLL